MAEVVALTSAIIAIIQITTKITNLTYQYINDIQKAPQSIRIFLNEIQSLTHVLNLLEEHRKKASHTSAIQILKSPLDECVMEMNMIAKKLEPKNNSSWFKRTIIRLRWPLKDREMSEYLSRIERFKTTIILAIGTANQSQQAAIMGGVRYVIENNSLIEAKALIEEKRELILHWLSSNTFDQRHTEISNKRDNIGQWLLGSQEFKNWTHDTDSRLLWVHGLAGSGKTFIYIWTLGLS
ncbi:hypothetical protein DFP73DRAFT_352692 [Morchella snyderi]|nr:hypothetical protein DFP73DRAFT_352692 [Morchella snyderi]